MKTIAITGIAGYVGSQLVPRLEECPEVNYIVGIDVNEPQFEMTRGHSFKADVRHPQITEIFIDENIDTVVHLAFVQDPIHQGSKAHELDVIGTMKVLNACAAAKVKKVIVASSYMVYGPRVDNPNFLTEDRPLRGLRELQVAKDKIEVERLCRNFKRNYPDTIVTVLRPAPVLGPHARHLIAKLFERPIIPTLMGFDPLLQFLHEEDMVDAYFRAILQDENANGTYNIAADGVIPMSKAIRLAGKVAAPIPHPLAFPMQGLLWNLRLSVIPPAMLNYMRYLNVMRNDTFKAVFGWQPRYTSEQTLVDFVQNRRRMQFQDENPDDLLLTDIRTARVKTVSGSPTKTQGRRSESA